MTQAATSSMATRSLGEIAASLPGATAVLRRHKLDFCCGGSESLEQAARHKGLALEPIEAELASLAHDQPEVPANIEDLIELILDRYHRVHRRELSELRQLARRVERVHADHPRCPRDFPICSTACRRNSNRTWRRKSKSSSH